MDVTRFNYDYTDQNTFTFGLFSDLHLDAIDHDAKQFTSDMDAIAEADGSILINGDLVDGIMPTDRKRYSRAGDTTDDDAQINAIAEYVCKRLEPWADFIDYIGFGNHEVSIVKYNNVDIIAMITTLLNQKRSKELPPIRRSGYVGFVNLAFSRDGSGVKRFVIYRDHGKGGASPVTKGTISLNRLYSTYAADLYWLGHSHVSMIDNKSQWTFGVTPQGNLYRKNKIGVITPGYNANFNEYEYDNESKFYKLNFPEERFYAPTGIGYCKLVISVTGESIHADASMH
jgi:hypothetical protein